MSALSYDVHVSPMVPAAGKPLADGALSQWSPLSHTLIYGAGDALLTDPPITRGQADELAIWVQSHHVTLRYIYLTHGHADHWLTTTYLQTRFPDAQVLASAAVLDRIAGESPTGEVPGLWSTLFGEAVPPPPVTVSGTLFPSEGLRLGGEELFAHEVGHSDTDDTSILHVPSLDLVVAGDVIYNNVHQYVAEGRNGGLDAWHRAIDQVAALRPVTVIAGHKDVSRPDAASDIEETRRYLDTAETIIGQTTDRASFYSAVREAYPDRVNPYTIWLGALRLFEN
jgi:glyoxylase-like metal-dependent hydrolase (beta-lactamase superfamily II)